MSEKISRRGFLKLASVGAATTAVLTGCGPASRYVQREPYSRMPEYTYNGLSTYYATTCRECAAGCGIIVRTFQGRALKVEGNPNHPVNRGKTCPRGQIALQGLYNPDRVQGPVRHTRGEALYNDRFQAVQPNMSWEEAIQVVADALANPAGTAFLMGTSSDHLFDLVSDLAAASGAPAPIRFGVGNVFDATATLSRAAEGLLGQAALPFFDIGNSDLVLSFGANFLETWLSPVAYNREYGKFRRGNPKRRGYLVQFEARMSQTAATADEWIPIHPGTEGLIARAIGRLVAEVRGGEMPAALANVDLESASSESGIEMETLEHIAQLVAEAASPIAIPGGSALGLSNGLQTAQAILALNAVNENIGKAGGVLLSPLSPNQGVYQRSASIQELTEFINTLNSGGISTLFIHGVNPLFELPGSLGFAGALANVGTVISFATFPDETAVAADYIFPDHHGLESWGYQRVATGVVTQSVLSGAQPVVSPFHNTRATADVILAAAQLAGGELAQALPFADEVEYTQNKLVNLVGQQDGTFVAPEINSFSAYFQQHGGWWRDTADLPSTSSASTAGDAVDGAAAEFAGEGEFFFLPFVHPILGETGANKPWLQEIADPTTTVMWNTWVEINPETAHELGLENDDVVKIISEAGEVEAPVYLYPAIHPEVIAMPFGQGHTAYGRYAQGRGANPVNLLAPHFNEAGDLAFAGMKVRLEKTGRQQILSRLESRIGVYGEGLGEEGH
ncbi:MAG TPA: molybdopterin-dependent oxidoreductase [Anaerolineales bacterium]|nr:molybdopterin-dependent oxidoreductase [Anaerolineales bacterium]